MRACYAVGTGPHLTWILAAGLVVAPRAPIGAHLQTKALLVSTRPAADCHWCAAQQFWRATAEGDVHALPQSQAASAAAGVAVLVCVAADGAGGVVCRGTAGLFADIRRHVLWCAGRMNGMPQHIREQYNTHMQLESQTASGRQPLPSADWLLAGSIAVLTAAMTAAAASGTGRSGEGTEIWIGPPSAPSHPHCSALLLC